MASSENGENIDDNGLLKRLERLVEASEKGDFGVVLDGGGLSGEEAEAVGMLNAVVRNYRDAAEHDAMKYRLMSDALGIALWDMDLANGDLFDPASRFMWSPELRRMLGFSSEAELPNALSSWIASIHPDDRQHTVDVFAQHLNDRTGTTVLDGEYRFQLKDGSFRHVHAFGSTLRDADGVALRVAGGIEDIEEKKRMEEALDYRRKMLDALNNMAVLLISHKDNAFGEVMGEGLKPIAAAAGLDRVAVYRRFDVSGKFGQIYLWYRGKTVPLDKELVVLPDVPPVIRWLDVLTTGQSVNGHRDDMPRDQAEFMDLFGVKSILFVPIFVREEIWGIVTLEDHTTCRYFEEDSLEHLRSAAHICAGAVARDEMEREINSTNAKLRVALDQATAASRAKSDFLSNMSHEMRTPLNTIIGMTAIGKKSAGAEQKNHALNKIGDASSHLLGVINDVLDMAKIEADKLELAPVEFNFEKMLQKVLTVVRFRADEKRQRLTVDVDGDIPRIVTGDDLRLSQVITNLLSNAVKFTPEEGSISLRAFLCGESNGVCELRVEITDSGIGIAPDQRERLFRAFEQADSGTSREYGGTGLGLVISKRIVNMMGGDISVDSELGKGARFTFTVKVGRAAVADDDDDRTDAGGETGFAIPAAGELRGKKMLLAEDVEINREILISLLEDTKMIIECAENGNQALEMIEAAPEKYDIVLMDVQMPHMDGLEATRRIRALPSCRERRKLPIIAMTANVFKSDIEACIEAGMDDHLGKPLDIDTVLATLRKHLPA